ncbi:MAG TPA: hypothetical protein VM100_07625, partial [Longimicrobiales bacterium]|nr:hypothetical protein [Longimicrobiales bacterium]
MAPKFITIGSKGVSIPTQLTRVSPPLSIGTNKLRWAGAGAFREARDAHGWVSENGEVFKILPL